MEGNWSTDQLIEQDPRLRVRPERQRVRHLCQKLRRYRQLLRILAGNLLIGLGEAGGVQTYLLKVHSPKSNLVMCGERKRRANQIWGSYNLPQEELQFPSRGVWAGEYYSERREGEQVQLSVAFNSTRTRKAFNMPTSIYVYFVCRQPNNQVLIEGAPTNRLPSSIQMALIFLLLSGPGSRYVRSVLVIVPSFAISISILRYK